MAALDPELQPHVDEAARLNNLDPMLLRALLQGESSNRPNPPDAGAGALGIAQIMPDTAKKYGIADPTDPVQGIYGAAKILNAGLTDAELQKQSGRDINPVDHALRTYFAGSEGPGWGPKTAAYPGYIAKNYQALTGDVAPPQQNAPVAVQPLSNAAAPVPPGVAQLAAATPARNAAASRYYAALDAAGGDANIAAAKSRVPVGLFPGSTQLQPYIDDKTGGVPLQRLGQVAPPGAGAVSPGIARLAVAGGGSPPVAPQVAQATQAPVAPSVEDLMRGLDQVAPLLRGAPTAPGGPPGAIPPQQGNTAGQTPVLGPQQVIDMLNTAAQAKGGLAAVPGLMSTVEKMLGEGTQFVQQPDGSIGIGTIGGATDAKRDIASAGKQGAELLQPGAGGVLKNQPGAVESAAGKAGAVKEAEQVPVRTTEADKPIEQRGVGSSTLLTPGSPAALRYINAHNAGQPVPPGIRINSDGSVEVGNVNVPGETVNERYKKVEALQEEANQSRLGIYEAQQLKNKLREIGTSGPMTDYLGKLSSLAQQVGVPADTIKAAALPKGASVEIANKLSTDLLGAILHQQFPQRITNTDITAWKNTVPRATTLDEANDFLIDKIVIPKFQRAVDRYGFVAGLSATDPQLTGYYKDLNDWDNAHPYDAYQIASEFKPASATPAAGAQPDRAAVEQEMRRRGLLK